MMMHTDEAKRQPISKTATALVELLAICPVCGSEGPAESQAECCRHYVSLWITCCAA